MTTTKRIISGGLSAWSGIGINLLTQLLLVPIYLQYWDSKTYGIWLAAQAWISLFTLLNLGHQQFLRYEFLRIGSHEKRRLQMVLWSSLPIALTLGLIEFSIVFLLNFFGVLPHFLGSEPNLSQTGGLIVLSCVSVWAFSGSTLGIAYQALSPFGYYPHFSWWSVGMILFTNICPIIAVLFGFSLLKTGMVWVISIFLVNIPFGIETWKVLIKEGLHPVKPNLNLGLKNFWNSQLLTLKSLLEMIRQQGYRILLVPLSGESGMVAFVTMRTGASVALQGLATITNPLMPELMRFLNQRNQIRSEMTFSIIWLAVISAMAPSVIILQAFVGPFFEIWTLGKVIFDPILFGMLSLGVIIFGIAQPAMAIIQGNNLLRAQLRISALSGFIALSGLFFFVKIMGISGAGLALLITEIVSAVCYVLVAREWLVNNELQWPASVFRWVLVSLLVTAISMAAMIMWPTFHLAFVTLGFATQVFCVIKYWRLLSLESRLHASNLILRFLPNVFRGKL